MDIVRNVILVIVLSVMIIMSSIAIYMLKVDIKSVPIKEIRKQYNLQKQSYMGRDVFVIKPKDGTRNNMNILYLHGGSYVAEVSKEHWQFIADLVESTGSTIIVPDYPLTPKYNYKDVFNMMEPLYKEIINKVGKENLIMMGDSAGGGMALALAEKIGEENIKQPKHIILLSPWLDVSMSNPEISKFEKIDPVLDKEALKIAGIAYSGEDGKDSFLVNPINGPLEKLENVTIYVGTYEMFNPDIHKLVDKAKQVNININLIEKEKAVHIWMIEQYKDKSSNVQENIKEVVERINTIIKE